MFCYMVSYQLPPACYSVTSPHVLRHLLQRIRKAGARAIDAARNASRAMNGRFVANITAPSGEHWAFMSFR